MVFDYYVDDVLFVVFYLSGDVVDYFWLVFWVFQVVGMVGVDYQLCWQFGFGQYLVGFSYVVSVVVWLFVIVQDYMVIWVVGG